jgi:hypothetical protein
LRPRFSPFARSPNIERNWKCPVEFCDRAYRQKGDLKVHVKTKHPEDPALESQISPPRSRKVGKPFPCPWEDCPCGFKWERDLKRHIRKKHVDRHDHDDDDYYDNSISTPTPTPTTVEEPVSQISLAPESSPVMQSDELLDLVPDVPSSPSDFNYFPQLFD